MFTEREMLEQILCFYKLNDSYLSFKDTCSKYHKWNHYVYRTDFPVII
jgi:hypothetical protein